MSSKEKNLCIIEFLDKKADWKSWSEKFLLNEKHTEYKKLLASSRFTSSTNKIPTQDDYENALKGNMDLNNMIIKLGQLNELACEDLILLIDTSSFGGKKTFELVRNAKSADFLEGNCKVA